MYSLKGKIIPGIVVWGKKKVYYDMPEMDLENRKCMYAVTMVNDEYFFGCPLTRKNAARFYTGLSPDKYPVQKNTRISECLYKLSYDDIVGPKHFYLEEKTFEHFKKNLYKKISVGKADSPKEYNDLFVSEYLKTHKPNKDEVTLYLNEDGTFDCYYIYEETEQDYLGIKLLQEKRGHRYFYSFIDSEFVNIDKTRLFFESYDNHGISRESVNDFLDSSGFQKRIGLIFDK